MKENIKALFEQIKKNDKHKVILEISQHVPQKPQSIQKNWLCDSAFWNVPDEHEDIVVTILQNWIANQNKVNA